MGQVPMGYQTVAINQSMKELVISSKKKKKGVEHSNIVPEPVHLEDLQKMFEGKLTIVNRLTFEFSDQLQAHQIIQNPVTKKYHLLAAIPKTQAAYNFTCSHLNVDIVTFDPGNKYPIKHQRKMYNFAARRGLYFELLYSPAASDGATRQHVITRGHMYYYFGKSKNVLISSNASVPLQLKGPYDVINIGLLFGLSEEQSKFSISEAGRKVLQHGACRRLGKIAPVLVEHSVQNSEDHTNDNGEDHDEDNSGSVKKRPRIS
ncbi:Ribonuclease P protein subunit p30 [Gryllus bimaculatus]|nr:Ribonuclease P protein subunit p30 [Gryllus bimaculatus]